MKKSISTIVFLICIGTICFGQADYRDSVLTFHKELESGKRDTTQVLLMLKMADAFFMLFASDSALQYSLKAVTLAREIGYQKGELKGLLELEVQIGRAHV